MTQTPPRPLLICATARSGSNLLADYLTETGRVGRIAEFFNPGVIRSGAFGARFACRSDLSLTSYIDFLVKSHASPHGVWGAKLLFEDVEALIRLPAMRDLLTRAKIVFLRRRSKLFQAISYYLAQSTGKWLATDPGRAEPEDVPFDFDKIREALELVSRQEALWTTLFALREPPPREIIYEDFLGDPGAHIRSLLAFAGVDPTGAPIRTTMREQKTPVSKQFAAAFVKAQWGASDPGAAVDYLGLRLRA